MAGATATIALNNTPDDKSLDFNHVEVYGTVSISASPSTYATGGVALNWAFTPELASYGITGPSQVWFQSVGGGTYEYGWNQANGTIQIFATAANTAGGAPYEELPNSTAIPASVSGDTIQFRAIFRRN